MQNTVSTSSKQIGHKIIVRTLRAAQNIFNATLSAITLEIKILKVVRTNRKYNISLVLRTYYEPQTICNEPD